jgi:hypothetical protein
MALHILLLYTLTLKCSIHQHEPNAPAITELVSPVVNYKQNARGSVIIIAATTVIYW